MFIRQDGPELEVLAPAKVNLFLEVTGKRDDGFHDLDMLMVPVALYDTLKLIQQQSLFLLFCLLRESPIIKPKEQEYLDSNFDTVVNNGREPNLTLETKSGPKPFRQLASELLEEIKPVASLMSDVTSDKEYLCSLDDQVEKIENVERTPSHRILSEMQSNNLTFFELALSYSQKWAKRSLKNKISKESFERLTLESSQSIQVQKKIEREDKTSFKQYLDSYYSQYSDL